MAQRKRNPRRAAVAQLREIWRPSKQLIAYWEQPQTKRDADGTHRKLVEAEKRENDLAAWCNLRDWAREIARRAGQLARYAEEQIEAQRK